MKKAEKQALDRAVACFSTQNEMADKIGVGRTTVSFWRYKSKKGVSAEGCVKIERATNGVVKKEELRPDLFA